jgi:hypothetical protein
VRPLTRYLALAAIVLYLAGMIVVLSAVTAKAAEPDHPRLNVIYRHVLTGAHVPFYVQCKTTGKYRAVWRGQWSSDKCGASDGAHVTRVRVPVGYNLKLRAWGCDTCRPWTLKPGVYAAFKPDRALWLVPR